MTTPRIEENKFEEYAYQVKHKKCEMVLDHEISWCGDCYACRKCGKIFIWSGVANETLTEAHQAGRDEAVEERKNLLRVIAWLMKENVGEQVDIEIPDYVVLKDELDIPFSINLNNGAW